MNLRRRSVLFLAVVVGLIAASAVVVAVKPVVLGLDLQGGVEVVLQGKPTRDSQVTPEAIARSVEVIRNRVDSFGVSEPEIQTQGSDQIVVSLPGAKNPDQVVEDLIKPAQLVFTDYEANFVASDPSLWKMVQRLKKMRASRPSRTPVHWVPWCSPTILVLRWMRSVARLVCIVRDTPVLA